jgi:hypothetical protein
MTLPYRSAIIWYNIFESQQFPAPEEKNDVVNAAVFGSYDSISPLIKKEIEKEMRVII